MRYFIFFVAFTIYGCKSNDSAAVLASEDGLICPVEPARDNCRIYGCIEREAQCGDEGYPLAYGERYCNTFLGLCNDALYTEDEKKWVSATALCLQEATYESQTLGDDCQTISSKSFETHSHCYTDGATEYGAMSFCELGPSTWRRIRGCIDTSDQLSRKGLRQLSKILFKCSNDLLGGFFLDSNNTPDKSVQNEWGNEAKALAKQWNEEAED